MIKCLDYRLTEIKNYSDLFKARYTHTKDVLNTAEIEGSYKNRLINDMNYYILEGCKLDNLLTETNRIKLDLINEYSQDFTSIYINKMDINDLINIYREYLKSGIIPVNNSRLEILTLSDYIYLLNNQEDNSFIYLLEYKCFLFKDSNDLSSSIIHYYFMCDEKVKLFNLLYNMKINKQIESDSNLFLSLRNLSDRMTIEKMLNSLKKMK